MRHGRHGRFTLDAPVSTRGAAAIVLYIIAAVLFLVAALSGAIGSLSELDVIALGLAAFALAHIVP